MLCIEESPFGLSHILTGMVVVVPKVQLADIYLKRQLRGGSNWGALRRGREVRGETRELSAERPDTRLMRHRITLFVDTLPSGFQLLYLNLGGAVARLSV